MDSSVLMWFSVVFLEGSVALRAESCIKSNSSSDSQSLSQRVILLFRGPQGTQSKTMDQNYLQFLVSFFGHNSSYTNSFWLRLCMRYATYHMQRSVHRRHSRKFIGKSLRCPKILYMSENHEFLCFGDVFGGVFGGFRCAARTLVDQIEFLK